MPVYKYKAMDKSGNKKTGELEAVSEQALKVLLKNSGLIYLGSDKKGGMGLGKSSKGKKTRTKDSTIKKPGLFSKVKAKELTVFSRQLATMINSGVSLLKAMSVLAAQNENPLFKQILEQVKEDLMQGSSFSAALGKHPKQFDKLFVSMVKAGEASGALETVLGRVAETMESAQQLKSKVRSAMTYPIIIMVVAFLIVLGLLSFVVPVFSKMFKDAGMKLPALTQFVANIGDFLLNRPIILPNVLWIIISSIVGLILFKKYIATDNGRKKYDTFMIKAPLLGPFTRKVAIARFTRTMSTLLNSGVPILIAFDIVADTVGNDVISKAIKEAKASIKDGATIAKPLADSGQFPTMVTQMIEIGEESGSIIEMLEKISDFNENEVHEAVDILTAAMEPIAIVVVAAIVGTIVIALFLPMFKMSDLV